MNTTLHICEYFTCECFTTTASIIREFQNMKSMKMVNLRNTNPAKIKVHMVCRKHDSEFCNMPHRGRVWLHISKKMADNSAVLWRHLTYIIALAYCALLMIVLIMGSSMSINYQSFNLNYIAAYQSLYTVQVSLNVTFQKQESLFTVFTYVGCEPMNIITITAYVTYKTHKHTHMH